MSVRGTNKTENHPGKRLTLSEDVEHTIRDGLGVRGNNVAAFTDAPGHGVDEPQEHEPAASQGVVTEDVLP